jgi:hypothetical protein
MEEAIVYEVNRIYKNEYGRDFILIETNDYGMIANMVKDNIILLPLPTDFDKVENDAYFLYKRRSIALVRIIDHKRLFLALIKGE